MSATHPVTGRMDINVTDIQQCDIFDHGRG